ncbi:DUF7946 domain-containing protein [Acinetobacter indicus]|uniref:DUF7946 domain-containing protein n=1 Tax=Acinetobacter indicus TaxID=756892 RepID=UPI000CEBF811|nr:hypothetical protein [Acinetobacter indicus]
MTDNAQSIKFKLSYQNGTADDHHLDMYDAAISYLGFAKAINITVNAILNKQVKVKGNQSGGFKVYLDTSKKAVLSSLLQLLLIIRL